MATGNHVSSEIRRRLVYGRAFNEISLSMYYCYKVLERTEGYVDLTRCSHYALQCKCYYNFSECLLFASLLVLT